jgi:hypothetical protein
MKMTSDNKSLELSPRVLAGKKEFSRWNSQSWAVVGGATQLYVISAVIRHRKLLEESNSWILGIKKENDVGLTDLVRF